MRLRAQDGVEIGHQVGFGGGRCGRRRWVRGRVGGGRGGSGSKCDAGMETEAGDGTQARTEQEAAARGE